MGCFISMSIPQRPLKKVLSIPQSPYVVSRSILPKQELSTLLITDKKKHFCFSGHRATPKKKKKLLIH